MSYLRIVVSRCCEGHKFVTRALSSKTANTDAMNKILHEEYIKAKSGVAIMMGMDPSHFSDADFQNSLDYLLPTDLKDKLARPIYNKGTLTIHTRKETIDERNRPCDNYFYSGAPSYYKLMYQIYHYLSVPPENRDNISQSYELRDRIVLERILDEKIKENKYDHLSSLVKDLNSCGFPSDEDFQKYFYNPSKLSFQKAHLSYKPLSVGRRKTSIAKVRVTSGEGKFSINAKSLLEYFPRLEDRQQILFPLNHVGCLGKIDVSATVHGGGITGQAGAIRVGLSRALANFSDAYVEPLEEKKLTMMDTRRVERKKPGQKKARKKFAWDSRTPMVYAITPETPFTPSINTQFSDNTVYTIGSLLKQTESRHVEYKAGGNYETFLSDYIKKYGSAFLNSSGGTLCIGVNDDGTIRGIRVATSSKMRRVKTCIRDEFKKFTPSVGEDLYEVKFARCNATDTYVLEILVRAGDPNEIYSDGDNKMYYKRDVSVEGPLWPNRIRELVRSKYMKNLEQKKIST